MKPKYLFALGALAGYFLGTQPVLFFYLRSLGHEFLAAVALLGMVVAIAMIVLLLRTYLKGCE